MYQTDPDLSHTFSRSKEGPIRLILDTLSIFHCSASFPLSPLLSHSLLVFVFFSSFYTLLISRVQSFYHWPRTLTTTIKLMSTLIRLLLPGQLCNFSNWIIFFFHFHWRSDQHRKYESFVVIFGFMYKSLELKVKWLKEEK